ncbi:AAEL017025-PA [Aedes aegypti]|uniref:AAEL017025-PA n=1 Tax=Aedes aegypti TaxID=7159 RepID=J9HY85_AEDAE|nr:AAEL017025-PA [Aedes aegypti]
MAGSHAHLQRIPVRREKPEILVFRTESNFLLSICTVPSRLGSEKKISKHRIPKQENSEHKHTQALVIHQIENAQSKPKKCPI